MLTNRVLATRSLAALAVGLAAGLAVSCTPPAPLSGSKPPEATVSQAESASGAVEIRVVGVSGRTISALEGIVAKVRFELTGPNNPNVVPVEVTRSQFTSNKATVHWSDLAPGPVTVAVKILDASGLQLGQATGNTTIKAGETAKLTLQIVPDTGSATFTLDVGGGAEPEAGLGLAFSQVATGSWQPAPPMAIPRATHGLVVLNGQAIAVGGDFNNLVERFDPIAWKWHAQFIPNDPDVLNVVCGVGVARNQIAIVGCDQETLGRIELSAPAFIDPFAAPFDSLTVIVGAGRPLPRYLGDLQAPRSATAVVSDGETLAMIGGSSKRARSSTLKQVFVTLDLHEILSTRTGQWSLRAPLPTARGSLGAALLGGKTYAVGGFRWKGTQQTDPQLGAKGVDANDASQEVLGTAEAYDPATDTWTSLAALQTPRHGLAVAASRGRLYAIGGAGSDGKPVATVESYDPASNSWRAEPPLNTARALVAATTLPDGTILVTGGIGTNGAALRSAEAFQP
jgi:hypothetical protein